MPWKKGPDGRTVIDASGCPVFTYPDGSDDVMLDADVEQLYADAEAAHACVVREKAAAAAAKQRLEQWKGIDPVAARQASADADYLRLYKDGRPEEVKRRLDAEARDTLAALAKKHHKAIERLGRLEIEYHIDAAIRGDEQLSEMLGSLPREMVYAYFGDPKRWKSEEGRLYAVDAKGARVYAPVLSPNLYPTVAEAILKMIEDHREAEAFRALADRPESDAQGRRSDAMNLSREEFRALTPEQRLAFTRRGGKLYDAGAAPEPEVRKPAPLARMSRAEFTALAPAEKMARAKSGVELYDDGEVIISRDDARNPAKYRAAKAQAEKSGVPFAIEPSSFAAA